MQGTGWEGAQREEMIKIWGILICKGQADWMIHLSSEDLNVCKFWVTKNILNLKGFLSI